MSNFLDKVKVNSALTNTTKLDLSCDHISTANFMQYNVAYSKELVPKEKISVNMETFTRLLPMPVPTFGRARINNRCFFVPFRTVMPNWNDFITDNKSVSGNVSTAFFAVVPKLPNGVLVAFIKQPTMSTTGSVTDYDYRIATATTSGVTYDYRKLTSAGRQFKKIIESLGYKIIPHTGNSTLYSALPLLCMAKVYHDWYYPSAYATDSIVNAVEILFKKDSSLTLQLADLNNIFNMIRYVNYDSDYFVSAWDNPTNPNDSAYSSITLSDPSQSSTTIQVSNGSANTGVTESPQLISTAASGFSQWAIDALKSVTDYMKRHQLVGARTLDRYMARFGIALTPEKLVRSVYVGSTSTDIQFGDIMSTADTSTSQLGNYAGKGIGYGQSSFDFSTDEYGMLMIISTIQPKAGYYQGIDRNVLHLARTDFWTPEFDNLGTQAISKGELYVDNGNFTDAANATANAGYTSDIFGWTPRYAEYKLGRDRLTGDFALNSFDSTNGAWHTMRELGFTAPANIVHNVSFITGQDAGQYDRIFYNTDTNAADKFNVIYHFDIASYSPMKSLFDTYEFEDKGKSMDLDVNGVKMN